MKKVVLGLSLMGGLLSASATEYLWYAADKSASGDFNGIYTNVCNWFISGKVNDGHVDTLPQTGADAGLFRYGGTYTVSFPAETDLVVTNFAKFQPSVTPGMSITFDGTDAHYVQPTNTLYSNYASQSQVYVGFHPTASAGIVDLMMTMRNLAAIGSEYAPKWAPGCEFTNFVWKVESPAGTKEAKITFEKGFFDFWHPDGVQWNTTKAPGLDNWTPAMPLVYFFGGQLTAATLDKAEVEVKGDAVLKVNQLDLMGSVALTNIFTFNGGERTLNRLAIGKTFNGWGANEAETLTDVVLDNAAKVTLEMDFETFDRARFTNRTGRVLVKNGSQLMFDGPFTVGYGRTQFLVDGLGSRMTMGSNGTRDQTFNSANTAFGLIQVTNKAKLVFDQMGTAAASGGKGTYFGSNVGNEEAYRFRLDVDDAAIELKPSAKITVYRAEVNFRNGATVENFGSFPIRGGDAAGGIRTLATVDHSFVTNSTGSTMIFGQGATGADLIITNGGEVVYLDTAKAQFFDVRAYVTPGSTLDFANNTTVSGSGRVQVSGVPDGGAAWLVADGGTVKVRSHYCAVGDNGEAHIVATNGGEVVVSQDIYLGGNDGSSAWAAANANFKGVVDVMTNGVVRIDTSARKLVLGYPPQAKGVVNVYPGGLLDYYIPGSSSESGLRVGYFGTGEVNLYGGKISTFRSWVGHTAKADYDYAKDDESVVRIYGGEYLINDQDNGHYQGFRFGTDSTTAALNTRRTRLVLNGGALTSYATFGGTSARCRGGTGYSALEADGGTVRPNTIASTVLIHHFDEAKVGAKGLTFDNRGFANAVPQHVWSNKEGEEGRLVFTGGGSTTVTGDVSEVSYLIADGATLDLSKLKNYTVGTLVVTNGGSVVLDPTRTLTVKGEFCVHDTGTIAFGSTVAVGTSCALLRQPQAPAEETLAALREAMMSARVTGLGSNRTADFAVAEDAGKFALEMTVRAPQTLVIPLEAGSVSNATETFTYDSLDTLLAEVGEGAALTLAGLYRYGAFRLDGGGKIAIDRLDERIDGAVSVKNGVLEPTVAGTYTKQIVFDAAGTNDIFVVKNDVDVTFPMPTGNKKGEFVKRGTGRLTFEVTGAVNFSGGVKGLVEGSYVTWGTTGKSVEQLKFDAQSGMVTNSGVPAICVVEGELRLVGKGAGASVTCSSPTAIGISTKEGSVQPGLVLDNVSLNVGAWAYVSPSINYASGAYARTGDFAKEAYLVLTNGAKFTCSQFEFAREAVGDDVHPSLIVDGSTFNPGNWFEIGIGPSGLLDSEVVFRNSRLYTRRYIRGTAVPVWFYNTVIANNEHEATVGLEPITIATIADSVVSGSGTAILHLRAGSELHCGTILPQTLNPASVKPITLDFEDSTWIPTTKLTDDYTFEWANPAQVLVAVTNGGLRLPVGAGAVWTMKQPVIGAGDLVNSGEGTLKLGPDAVAFTGALRTDAGTVDFDGNALAPLIAGGGTFANGTLTGGIVYTSEEKVPTLDGLALATDARVKFVVPDAETPGQTYTVAKYTGDAAPDVSTLRFKSGAGVPLKGAFTVDTEKKTITCTTALNGMILILE